MAAVNRLRPRTPVPQLARGVVVRLPPGTWRYGDGELILYVERVRHDLSRYYDDRVWLEGVRLTRSGTPADRVQVLVDIAALTDVAAEPEPPTTAARAPAPDSPDSRAVDVPVPGGRVT